MIVDLQTRGIIHQVTDPLISNHLSSASQVIYAGFDPSADSLHAGNLFSIITLKRFMKAGHQPIALVGGATGRIGDPSGKSSERTLMSEDQLQKNLSGIQEVLTRILGKEIRIFDNYDWFKNFNYIDFLRTVGKHFTVNYMVGKESVRARLEDRDQGISYTEFSYMLLQSYDFYYLNKNYGCSIQIGGADQWGNITAGTELIRRMGHVAQENSQSNVFGLTTPLLTKSDGTKFGKSESGAVWLSEDKTSVYDFYQFWFRVADSDVIHFLKVLTFLEMKEIEVLENSLKTAPEKREAQKRLAQEITLFVHGAEALAKVEGAATSLFSLGNEITKMNETELNQAFGNSPKTQISQEDFSKNYESILDLLVKIGLSSSKGEAKKDIQGGGISMNQEKVSDIQLKLSSVHLLAKRYILFRKGKKNFHVVEIIFPKSPNGAP